MFNVSEASGIQHHLHQAGGRNSADPTGNTPKPCSFASRRIAATSSTEPGVTAIG